MSSPSSTSSTTSTPPSSGYVPPPSHRLHSGYSHCVLKAWQSDCSPVTATDLVYPIFVTDEENKVTPINSLPEQSRHSVDK